MSGNCAIDIELCGAVRMKDLEKIKVLLSAGANANYIPPICRIEESLLHRTDDAQVAKLLILAGARVNHRNKYRETPLRTAITHGKNVKFIEELLKHGSDVNASDRQGNSPLIHAVKRKDVDQLPIVKELLIRRADINHTNREGCSALDYAVSNMKCVELLIKYTVLNNFDRNYRNILDLTPYKTRSNYNLLSTYFDDCVCEVTQMKTDIVVNNLPLYEFVTKGTNLLYYNHFSTLMQKLNCIADRYPIYHKVILENLQPFFQRADLLNKLTEIPIYTVDQDSNDKRIILNNDCSLKVSNYLFNKDLLNLIVSYDRLFSLTREALEPSTFKKRLLEASTSDIPFKHAKLE